MSKSSKTGRKGFFKCYTSHMKWYTETKGKTIPAADSLWTKRLNDPEWRRGVDSEDAQVTLWVPGEEYTDDFEELLHFADVSMGQKDRKAPKDDAIASMVKQLESGPPGSSFNFDRMDTNVLRPPTQPQAESVKQFMTQQGLVEETPQEDESGTNPNEADAVDSSGNGNNGGKAPFDLLGHCSASRQSGVHEVGIMKQSLEEMVAAANAVLLDEHVAKHKDFNYICHPAYAITKVN